MVVPGGDHRRARRERLETLVGAIERMAAAVVVQLDDLPLRVERLVGGEARAGVAPLLDDRAVFVLVQAVLIQ
eukprot:3117965-Pleurochrysis_carterae.AAC.1